MNVISLFSGAGGLDLGFLQAGFNIILANESDKTIWPTYELNFSTPLIKDDLRKISTKAFPKCDGIIGGPPCQSWSDAGNLKGINDPRGILFFEYIKIIKQINPLFFVIENVPGIASKKHIAPFNAIKYLLEKSGYILHIKTLNAIDYKVPQTRKRLFIVGFQKKLNIPFKFPKPSPLKLTLKDAIWDLRINALPWRKKHLTSQNIMPNHEYLIEPYSPRYLTRNRVRSWNEPSFTIPASARHIPQHPQAPKMVKIKENKFIFNPQHIHLYRRLSVRECARIQTFPDDFHFKYSKITDGYKMVGNAVPINLAFAIANQIKMGFENVN